MIISSVGTGCQGTDGDGGIATMPSINLDDVFSDAPESSDEISEDESSEDESREEESSEEETSAPETTTTEATTESTTETATETTTETTTESTPESTEETPPPVEYDINSYRQIGQNGILVAGINDHYWGIMFYGGTYGYCDQYVYDVKEFQAALPQVSVYSMVIPTSVDFYNPPEYAGYTAVQEDKIKYIEAELSKAGITNISVYDVLESHKDEQIYSRTDHHWMPLGAYYAAKQFCDSQKLTISPLSKYRKATYGGYVGSMYYYSQDYNLYNDPEDYDVYYSPNEDKLTTTYYNRYYSGAYEGNLFMCNDASYYYLSFLGSDDLIAHVKTNVKNGRNLVVIKESYGNALIPFLTEAFENIYVIDLRYCNVNAIKFCKDVDATDLLFANCAYTVAGGNCEYFSYIRNI
ncbi:MAG: hypothetical protein E7490_10330 [Ruminococcaceae bacterium]|nr:hypothetical protein [Oscillospiraceae bacterium]